ncbi:MAG: hypothetical protein L0332_31770 [Chloroflexi bacterium]|nr:hypothetical protein [Chloroflexota bacterium]MCI0731280.1 hypothetical protein [Chloroflexota bacterium]
MRQIIFSGDTEITERTQNIHPHLLAPPREFSVTPFWFWNDALDEEEIVRQIADFEAHGVYGFVIHPRVGLPRDLGWMSGRLLHFYDLAIQEARRRQMTVILYDEGMYPSGSSSGQVVAQDPAYHCRCLAKIDLPPAGEPALAEDQHLVAVVERANGQRLAVIDRRADSFIRGLHYLGEGPAEDEPPAADLLNPAAVGCFIRLVYDTFAARFAAYFGSTITGIFTDEPNLLGRCRERPVFPGTAGILAHVNRILGYDFTPHLPALWFDDEPQAGYYRRQYLQAVNVRLEETWYAPLHDWCQERDLALMGHPAQDDDISHLRYFHVPGQDLIWRWVLPDHPSALQGTASTQAKCSSSAMVHGRRRRNANECCGAYGHEFTWEEMVWLANWCFVRGVNWLIPHAFYYSVRGPRRDERPPDVGPRSSWWPRYGQYADGCRRLSWLNTGSLHVCHLAILGGYNALPWPAARLCFQHQRDFNYLDERQLFEEAELKEDGLHLAGMCYQALIAEHEPALAAGPIWQRLEQAGRLLRYEAGLDEPAFVRQIDQLVPPDVTATPAAPNLRARHVVKHGRRYYLLFNEGQVPLETRLSLAHCRHGLLFDPYTGRQAPFAAATPLRLAGHQLVVIAGRD